MRPAIVFIALLAAVAACKDPAPPPEEARPVPADAAAIPPPPWKPAAIAHGGVGSPPEMADGCRAAVDAALAALEAGADPVEAAVAGVKVMEDDPRYNAGTGSRVRIDGETVQMDAAVMDSTGRFGSIAVVEGVKNPVEVARAVLDTPHIMLAGDGATAFARSLGMPVYDPATPEMKAATAAIMEQLKAADPSLPERWQAFDWRGRWNFERTLEEAGLADTDAGTDTVGVAVRTADGRFAVALSTGGTAITLRGRVGDVPIFGAGLYAGDRGAAAATGAGERIVEAGLARAIHAWMAGGASAQQAADRAVALLRERGAIGVIVIAPEELAAAADRPMAWAARELGSDRWLGP
jgi:L-asparaginase / beta-aspartyl-peptidase